jgi:hypothetical protein
LCCVGGTALADCLSERGSAAAKLLVDRCLEVSPATHPPCNAANDCSLIESEIRRGCGFLSGADAPAYCKDYR